MKCFRCSNEGYQSFMIEGKREMLCEDCTDEQLDVMAQERRNWWEGEA